MNTRKRTDFDAELRRHNEALRRATGIRSGDHVLDLGCGTGQTTREAAQVAQTGDALGIDISEQSIDCARRRAERSMLRNVAFEHADAQTHPFRPGYFDVAISRFGTMFFGDPAAAFANIQLALRPAGRLVMAVWQARDANAWVTDLDHALAAGASPVAREGLNPFSLADPQAVTELLEAAGFCSVNFSDVSEPVYYGADVDAALAWVEGFTCTSQALNRRDPADAEATLERVRRLLAAHMTDDGVWFDSRAWIISAEVAQLPGQVSVP